MKRVLAVIVLLLALLGPKVAHADPIQVQWAGVSFLSPPGRQATLAPRLRKLLEDPAVRAQLDQRILTAISGVASSSPNWSLVTDLQRQGDDSYLLTFAIEMENVEAVSSGGLSSTSYEIQASVLVANLSKDPSRQRIVNSYPVRVRFNTIDDDPSDPQQHAKIFKALLVSPTSEMPDLVAQWAARTRDIELREKKVWLRVAPLGLSSDARREIDQLVMSQGDRDIISQMELQASALLEAQLSEKLDIPIIPFGAKGEMEAMMLHFANLDAGKSFKPPNPDFSIKVDVRTLRHVVNQSMSRGGTPLEQQVFGGAFVVSLISEDPDALQPGQDLVPPLQLRRIDATDLYAAGTRQFSILLQFRKLVGSFSNELGLAFSQFDPGWFKVARSDFEPRDPKQLSGKTSDFGKRLSKR